MKKILVLLLSIFIMLIISCNNTTESDNTPPTVVITYPANNSDFEEGTEKAITADANDNKGVEKVEFYIDGTRVSTDTNEPYQYDWDTGAKRNSNHTIYTKAYDSSNNSASSDVITITLTEPGGNPPNPPTNPTPANNATSVSTNADLFWTCTDPDNDPLTYNVYFGTSTNPPQVSNGQSSTDYDPGTLNEETIYYWKIQAHDDHSNHTTGDVWKFTTFTGGTGTVTDIDGNVYQTIVIGNQEWMMENLKVTHYRNGDQIPHLTDDGDWASTFSGAYCVYDNDPSYANTYGNLYNWFAVDDSRGLAPEGWHVPTHDDWHADNDWNELVDYLGGSVVAGGKMKETGTTHWNSPNTGATNESGFTALPGGYKSSACGGYFGDIGVWANFWSSSDLDSNDAWTIRLYFDDSQFYNFDRYKKYGFSIRCVKD